MTKATSSSRLNGQAALFDREFDRLPLMAILRGYNVDRTVELCQRAWRVGIRLVEVPIQSPSSLAALRAAVAAGAENRMPVGAGTVTTLDRVTQVASAGAAFTVAPGLSHPVAEASLAAGMPHLPGVATASEIQRAMQLGMSWLKMFPASDLGAPWIRSMRGPFPEVRFVATGGIHLGNAAEFLDAGAGAVSLGSALADPDQVDALPQLINGLMVSPHSKDPE